MLALFVCLFVCFVWECFCGCVHVCLGTGRSMIASCLCETVARGRIYKGAKTMLQYCGILWCFAISSVLKCA